MRRASDRRTTKGIRTQDPRLLSNLAYDAAYEDMAKHLRVTLLPDYGPKPGAAVMAQSRSFVAHVIGRLIRSLQTEIEQHATDEAQEAAVIAYTYSNGPSYVARCLVLLGLYRTEDLAGDRTGREVVRRIMQRVRRAVAAHGEAQARSAIQAIQDAYDVLFGLVEGLEYRTGDDGSPELVFDVGYGGWVALTDVRDLLLSTDWGKAGRPGWPGRSCDAPRVQGEAVVWRSPGELAYSGRAVLERDISDPNRWYVVITAQPVEVGQ